VHIDLQQTTDEPVGWYPIDIVLKNRNIVPNLKWLIPMAYDKNEIWATIVG
jgi:hypothetical protein